MLRLRGSTEMEKSAPGGGGGLTTRKETSTKWKMLPLTAKTLTVQLTGSVAAVVKKLRVAVPTSPGINMTTLVSMLQLGQVNARHGTDVERSTMPVKPLRLVSMIVELADSP